MHAMGLEVALPFDAKQGSEFDLLSPRVLSTILGWIASGRLWVIFLAPPCT